MNGLKTVSFEALVECIDLASGNPDAFMKLLLERNGEITITDKDKPRFLIQKMDEGTCANVDWLDSYESELDLRM